MKRAGESASAAEALGDLYRLSGRKALAQDAYRDAFEYLRYETRYGVHMSLDLATFQVDRGIRLGEGLALARAGTETGRVSSGTTPSVGRSSETVDAGRGWSSPACASPRHP